MTQYVKWVDLDQALNAYRKTPTPPPPPDSHPSPEAVEALQKVGELANRLEGFLEEYKQLQVHICIHILITIAQTTLTYMHMDAVPFLLKKFILCTGF